MATKEQIAANRKNAKKSTGPRSQPGKDKVKLNGLRHGLRAEQLVLPSEDAAEFKAFVDAWMDDWKPTTMARAARPRGRRLGLAEGAVRPRRGHPARPPDPRYGRAAPRQEERAVDKAVAALPDDPRGAVERLLATRAGVERMIGLWSGIAEAATPEGWDDAHAHHFRVIFLCGRMPADDEAVGLRDDSWRLYLRNAPADMIADDDPEPWNDAEADEVAAGLRGLAAGRIAELRDALDRLADPVPSWLAQAEAEALLPLAEDAPAPLRDPAVARVPPRPGRPDPDGPDRVRPRGRRGGRGGCRGRIRRRKTAFNPFHARGLRGIGFGR